MAAGLTEGNCARNLMGIVLDSGKKIIFADEIY